MNITVYNNKLAIDVYILEDHDDNWDDNGDEPIIQEVNLENLVQEVPPELQEQEPTPNRLTPPPVTTLQQETPQTVPNIFSIQLRSLTKLTPQQAAT